MEIGHHQPVSVKYITRDHYVIRAYRSDLVEFIEDESIRSQRKVTGRRSIPFGHRRNLPPSIITSIALKHLVVHLKIGHNAQKHFWLNGNQIWIWREPC